MTEHGREQLASRVLELARSVAGPSAQAEVSVSSTVRSTMPGRSGPSGSLGPSEGAAATAAA